MSAPRSSARPAVVPGSRRDTGTMVAALYGVLSPHNWHDPEHDAYQLFYQRSLAMGWMDDTSAGGGSHDDVRRAPGLWGMNDAGWEHPLGAVGTGLIAWFQVGVSAVADDRPLPIQPFLRCAEDATARAGALEMSAVQLLLPIQGLDPASRPPWAPVPALRTVHWFAERDPHAKTLVAVHINTGLRHSTIVTAEELVERLARLDQDVFVISSHDTSPAEDIPPPPFGDGPTQDGIVLRGALAEWSCDAIGWLAEVIADIVAQMGARSPLLLTTTRAHPPH